MHLDVSGLLSKCCRKYIHCLRCLQYHPEVSLTGLFFNDLFYALVILNQNMQRSARSWASGGCFKSLSVWGTTDDCTIELNTKWHTHTQTQSFRSWNGMCSQPMGKLLWVRQILLACPHKMLFLSVLFMLQHRQQQEMALDSIYMRAWCRLEGVKTGSFLGEPVFLRHCDCSLQILQRCLLSDSQVVYSGGLFVCLAAGQRGRNDLPLF